MQVENVDEDMSQNETTVQKALGMRMGQHVFCGTPSEWISQLIPLIHVTNRH